MWEIIQSNKRKSAVLVFLLAAVLIVLGYAIGASLDPQTGGPFGLIAAAGLWFILMATSFAGGDKILLATAGAREVTHNETPQLFNIVEEMKIASGLPAMPRVYIIDNDAPNAFAVGVNPKRASVAVTTGLLARLNRDELQGVIAHEIGHVVNRDILFMTLAGVTVGAILILVDLYLRGMLYGSRGRSSSRGRGGQGAALIMIVALVLAILAPLLAQLLYFACSRRREYLADASGAQFTRYPEGLAAALEKISAYTGGRLQVNRAVAPMFTVNPLSAAGASSNIFSTHPPTADRIRVLRGMAKGSSLAAYEEAFRAAHGDRGVIGARTLKTAPADSGIRGPAAAEPKSDPAKQWRQAQDILHKLNQFAVISCACGLSMKLPPGFDQPAVACPRCGRRHEVPLAELQAAAAALASRNTPQRPIYK
jgi:heat shock protein HtpX